MRERVFQFALLAVVGDKTVCLRNSANCDGVVNMLSFMFTTVEYRLYVYVTVDTTCKE